MGCNISQNTLLILKDFDLKNTKSALKQKMKSS